MLREPSDKEGKPSEPYTELAIYLAVILGALGLLILFLDL